MKKYDKNDIEEIKKIDIVEWIKYENFEIDEITPSTARIKNNNALVIDRRKNLWNCFNSNEGGSIIDLVMKLKHLSYLEALNELSKSSLSKVVNYNENLNVTLPIKCNNNNIIIEYLVHKRKINEKILYYYIETGLIFQEIGYNNCVFVSKDENNNIKGAFIRGTSSTFKMMKKNSKKKYPFVKKGELKRIYVFESPIDLLSYETLAFLSANRIMYETLISLNGLTIEALDFYVEHNQKEVKEIVLCIDNDIPADNFANIITNRFDKFGIKVIRHKPQNKDFNEDLIVFSQNL